MHNGAMKVIPRSRGVRIGLAVLAVAAVAVLWIRRDDVRFVKNLVLPDRTYSAAESRTTDPVAVSDDGPALPEPRDAVGATGNDPDLALGALLAMEAPSAVADPPGPGPVLVTTLDGRVHAVDLDAGTTEVVLDLTSVVSTGGERGLLGAAIDPEGERLYLDYTDDDGDTDIRSWPLDDGRPEGDASDGVLHLEIGQPFPNHNGGNLVFGPDGALWVATGDGGGAGDRGEVAQDDSVLLGKMLRVVPDPDGGVVAPSTNPEWERPEIWAIGLRNPWRWSFDRDTDQMWIADVGQNTIEEVSVADGDAPSPNFGWDVLEGLNEYEGEGSDDFIDPVVTYGRDGGCSITGGYVYRGDAIEGLHGWYLFSDYCTGWIRAVPADDPTIEPVELATDIGNVISYGELEDGELVVLTTEGIRRIEAP